MSSADELRAHSPAKLLATPTHSQLGDQMVIFDILRDPRKSVSDIESFVLADPTCLGAVNDENGCTPLHEAARRGNSQLIRCFVNNGATVEVRGHLGETPFLLACDVSVSHAGDAEDTIMGVAAE